MRREGTETRKSSPHKRRFAGAVALAALLTAAPALAEQQDKRIQALERQIKEMSKTLKTLKEEVAASKREGELPAGATETGAKKRAPAVRPASARFSMPNNRPTFCSADGNNCIALTGRLHIDAGMHWLNRNPTSPPHSFTGKLHDGVTARRAQIGVIGRFFRDWEYSFVYDAGGSSGPAPPNQQGIDTAYIAYKGIKPITIIGGYFSTPYTLDESTSSNNITFMERAAPQQVAVGIAGGSARSAFGAYGNGRNWWLGGFVTGRTSTNVHTERTQLGATARGVFLPILTDSASLLIGGDAQFLIKPQASNTLRLRDRIEMRVDPNRILDTGAIASVDGARVLSAELAGGIGSFYFQGEYFDFKVNRIGLPDLNFEGAYIQGSYVLTGESRRYSASSGAYGGINPRRPFEYGTGNPGAWEVAARYSETDLSDLTVDGGRQKAFTVGVNWYVNANMRFMFNYINGKVDFVGVAKPDIEYQALGMRAQVAF